MLTNKIYIKYLYPLACATFMIAFLLVNISFNFHAAAMAQTLIIASSILCIVGCIFCVGKLVFVCRCTKRRWILFFGIILAAVAAARNSGNFLIVIVILFLFSSNGEDFEKNYQLWMVLLLIGIAIVFLGTAVSAIPITRWDAENAARGGRLSLGLGNPNILGYFLLYSLWFWLYIRYKAIKWVDILIPTCLTAVIWGITKSRAALLSILLTALLVALFKLPKLGNMQKMLKKMMIYSPLICGVVSFVSVFFFRYNQTLAPIINKLFSGRLELYSLFLRVCPFTLFGYNPYNAPALIRTLENGSTDLKPLDNIYINTYVNLGFIFLIILLGLWVYALRRAYLADNIPLLIIGVVSAAYGIVEATQMSVILSPILISAFTIYPNTEGSPPKPTHLLYTLFKPSTWARPPHE